jgi:glutathione peroxidase-family protein
MRFFFITSIVVLSTGTLFFTGCKMQPKFTVEGNITNASGKTVYLEMRDIDKNTILDSCKLNEKGTFSFKQLRPEYPQFYALKLNNQSIFFSVDSTETLTIKADANDFTTKYEIEGSDNAKKIKELCLLQYNAQLNVNKILKSGIPKDSVQKKVTSILDDYKKAAIAYILSGQNSIKSPAAYFALFQRINNYLIFDPYDPKDNKIFAAVATAYDIAYPDSPRSKHLKNLTLQAMADIKPRTVQKEITAGYSNNIEISLPNVKEEIVTLSSTAGKVVLLDFTMYETEFSPEHNMALREIYNKYVDKGFQVYQVSLDANENFWKVSASNLPWICVRDKNSRYSDYALMYNVSELPTYFLIDRKGELIKRNSQIKNLEEEIKKLL